MGRIPASFSPKLAALFADPASGMRTGGSLFLLYPRVNRETEALLGSRKEGMRLAGGRGPGDAGIRAEAGPRGAGADLRRDAGGRGLPSCRAVPDGILREKTGGIRSDGEIIPAARAASSRAGAFQASPGERGAFGAEEGDGARHRSHASPDSPRPLDSRGVDGGEKKMGTKVALFPRCAACGSRFSERRSLLRRRIPGSAGSAPCPCRETPSTSRTRGHGRRKPGRWRWDTSAGEISTGRRPASARRRCACRRRRLSPGSGPGTIRKPGTADSGAGPSCRPRWMRGNP